MSIDTVDDTKTIVDKALASVGELATLPEVTVRIIDLVDDHNSTARDLHAVIKNDPALSVKVLKVVNSAFYGLPGQVASVDRAIILLGLSAVKNISIAASIARLFKGKRLSEQFSAADLWRHSVAVAVAARTIAKYSPHPVMTDEVFVAGLIHDIGMLIEYQVFCDEFTQVVDECTGTEVNFMECERRIIGADHQAFGVGLTTKWKFPRHLRAVVGFHHNPESLSVELRPIATLLHMADVICCQERLGFYLTAQHDTVTEEMLDTLGVTEDNLVELRETLPDLLAEAEATLSS